jgi:hypothetical protein
MATLLATTPLTGWGRFPNPAHAIAGGDAAIALYLIEAQDQALMVEPAVQIRDGVLNVYSDDAGDIAYDLQTKLDALKASIASNDVASDDFAFSPIMQESGDWEIQCCIAEDGATTPARLAEVAGVAWYVTMGMVLQSYPIPMNYEEQLINFDTSLSVGLNRVLMIYGHHDTYASEAAANARIAELQGAFTAILG